MSLFIDRRFLTTNVRLVLPEVVAYSLSHEFTFLVHSGNARPTNLQTRKSPPWVVLYRIF